jgi:oligoribonuclease NrnB/cAMP/cGMP phosphodiesterase (DHH superfamily)
MRKWKLLVGVVLVFVLGVLVGSLGTGLYFKHHFVPHKRDSSAVRAFLLKRFSQELDLTENQKNEFKRLIDQVGDQLEDHFRKTHSEIAKIIDQGSSQMRKTLSPDQQKKFDELIEKFERHRRARTKFGPPRPR